MRGKSPQLHGLLGKERKLIATCFVEFNGMMKGYVAVPVRLPTGELTGYIGITEGKVPKEFHLSRVVTFPKKSA
jgi:hypothetical protein